MKGIFKVLNFWANLRFRYDTIAKDPERKEKSIYFGVRSIISSIFSAIVIALSVWGIFACSNAMNADSLNAIVAWVFIVLLAVITFTALCNGFVSALISTVYQLRLNKKPIGWVALAILIVSFVGAIIAALLLLKVF